MSYLILSNIGKRQNFGTLLRSAAAFGVVEVFVVGEKKLKTFGNQGTVNHLKLSFYEDYHALRTRLKDVTICGIEITDQAAPIHKYPFRGSTAFMLGNEGVGMSAKQLSFCEDFVYVPQYSKATASLNVAVAGSIVLQHFAVWAGFPETERSGFKFSVERPRSALEAYRNPDPGELEMRKILQASRWQKKLQHEEEACVDLDMLDTRC